MQARLEKLRGSSIKSIANICFHKLRKHMSCIYKPFEKMKSRAEFSDEELLDIANSYSLNNLCGDFLTRRVSFLEDLALISNHLSEDAPDYCRRVTELAERYIQHSFNLLGSGEVHLRYGLVAKGVEGYRYHSDYGNVIRRDLPANYEPIDWHIDFKSGYRWSNTLFYKDIKYGHDPGADIKVPWELSRCYHFAVLGQAYRLTKKKEYAVEIRNQIIDWINNNPYCFGPNWVCTMEVAIRVANWLLAYCFIQDSGSCDSVFVRRFLKSLYQHAVFIRRNLEKTPLLSSNHYVSDLVGLLFVSILVPQFKASQQWREFAVNELEMEITKQTYCDGVDFEASTSYHRLVTELFAYAAILCKKNHIKLSSMYERRLKKMFLFAATMIKPSGSAVQLGDNDSGQLFRFFPRSILDHNYLTVLGRYLVGETQELSMRAPELCWVTGVDTVKRKKAIIPKSYGKAFKCAGVYVYRSPKVYVAIFNGPNGQNGRGGHCHNDKLSFVLTWLGNDILVDPGSYLYTAIREERNRFRSTSYHNTVMVAGHEQNRFTKQSLFELMRDTQTRVDQWTADDSGFRFRGSHSGYRRVDDKLVHVRDIIFSSTDSILRIHDIFADDLYSKEFCLMFAPGIKPKISQGTVNFKYGRILFNGADSITLEPCFYSPEYGLKVASWRLVVRFKQELKSSIQLSEPEG